MPRELKILHFNDVYDIEDKKSSIPPAPDCERPIASASRFITAMRQAGSKEKLVLFSGDLFAPDKISYLCKGE
jgi:hypothetical protein